jgi:hypothetical protein
MPGLLDGIGLLDAPDIFPELKNKPAGTYVDFTALPDKKSPISRLLSFLPLILGGLFILYLLGKK